MRLPLSYTWEKSNEVYKETELYLEQSRLYDDLCNRFWMYISLRDLIPQNSDNLWSGHVFPYEDSSNELQVSYNICCAGFYKQAMSSLRSALELGLLSVYWNINDDGHITIKSWLSSKLDTPRIDEIWHRVSKHKNFRIFQEKYNLKDRLLKLNDLHNYVHTKGYHYSNYPTAFKSNFQTFEEDSFIKWYNYFNEVVDVLTLLHLIKYPLGTLKIDYSKKFGVDVPTLGGLQIYEVERIEDVLGNKIFSILYDIAEQDEHVNSIRNWMNELDDMTEDDVYNQIMKLEKSYIEHEGLNIWKRNMGKMYEILAPNERNRKMIDQLIQWAKENDYIEHSAIRLAKKIKGLKEQGKTKEEIAIQINEEFELVSRYYEDPDKLINNLSNAIGKYED